MWVWLVNPFISHKKRRSATESACTGEKNKINFCCFFSCWFSPVCSLLMPVSDHSGADAGERLYDVVSSGSVSNTLSRGLPQHEEDGKPTASVCGAGRCQGQNQTPSPRTVSVTATSQEPLVTGIIFKELNRDLSLGIFRKYKNPVRGRVEPVVPSQF